MTKQQALSFLNLDLTASREEVEDRLEELLFEHKNYFINKLPIKKLFLPKLKELSKLKEIQLVYGLNERSNSVIFNQDVKFSDNLLDAFNLYQNQRNLFKLNVLNTNDLSELEELITKYLFFEKEYQKLWDCTIEKDNFIKVSVFPDEILILQAIKNYQLNGGFTFSDLVNLKNNPSEILVQEMKRLSLLYNLY